MAGSHQATPKMKTSNTGYRKPSGDHSLAASSMASLQVSTSYLANAVACGHMAVGQNQWYHFGVGAPPSLVYFSEDWDVHWGYGILTHGHIPHYMFCAGCPSGGMSPDRNLLTAGICIWDSVAGQHHENIHGCLKC